MDNPNYLPDTDRFFAEHPEIDPAVRGFVEPAVTDSQEAVFSFIISYIFM